MKTFTSKILGLLLGSVLLLTTQSQVEASRYWPLKDVIARADLAQAQGFTPVMVFDLDETLIDSIPRLFTSFKKVLGEFCRTTNNPSCGALSTLTLRNFYGVPNRYDKNMVLKTIGVVDPEIANLLDTKGIEEYLSGRYTNKDRPYAGVVPFLIRARLSGTRIYFVSSRFADTQGAPTAKNLINSHVMFPNETAQLLLRPRNMSSLEFKMASFRKINTEIASLPRPGRVVGAFENEPENLLAMGRQWGNANLIFVRGAFLKWETLPPGVGKISNYRGF